MEWLNRLLGRTAPERTTVTELAGGYGLMIAARTETLVKFLEAEGLAQEALQRFALWSARFRFECLLFLAFPFYAMMPTEFGAHSGRLSGEFVKCLIVAGLGEDAKELSGKEFAEAEELVVTTLRDYNHIWQTGEMAGDVTRRLGALAFERILGRGQGPPNYKVWNLLFMETNNAFKNTMGIGSRFDIVA